MTEWEIARNSAIIGGISGAVIAGLLGIFSVWWGTWLNRNAAQKAIDLALPETFNLLLTQEYFKMAKEFCAAFYETIERLQPISLPHQNAEGILRERMFKHKLSYNSFRPLLERIKGAHTVAKFDAIWKEYYNQEKYNDFPWQAYRSELFSGDKEAKEEAIKRIQAILDFVNNI